MRGNPKENDAKSSIYGYFSSVALLKYGSNVLIEIMIR
jgi:hypothetical protein